MLTIDVLFVVFVVFVFVLFLFLFFFQSKRVYVVLFWVSGAVVHVVYIEVGFVIYVDCGGVCDH